MSYEDLIFSCRKLVALHDVFDELYCHNSYDVIERLKKVIE